MDKEIIYIGDPMCSWCYGFSGVIGAIRDRYGDRVAIRLVMGGLRPDGTHVVSDAYRNFLRSHWHEIQARTGQPFAFTLLEHTGWIYDTEKACRAVVAARQFGADMDWRLFSAVQRGFYADNHDPNDNNSYVRIAADIGIPGDEFLAAYESARSVEATRRDIAWARSVGVDAFPTVLLRDGERLEALTIGYRPLEALVPRIEKWLQS